MPRTLAPGVASPLLPFQDETAVKLCECGCGKPTPIADRTDAKHGAVKGQPRRFRRWHHLRLLHPVQVGDRNPSWSGGRFTLPTGYVKRHAPDHPDASGGGHVLEHRLIAERALGKPLPLNAVVHHANGDRADNRRRNLVICESPAYHNLLHRRQRAFGACGHAHWRLCHTCKRYDDPARLYVPPRGAAEHRSCHASRERERMARKALGR